MHHVSNVPRQKIGYLEPIPHSPTSPAVIKTTLDIACELANECQQEGMIVTYDLAICIKAYQIQLQCSPLYDHLFIHMGPFHVELSMFKAVGRMIEESGISELMVQAGLIANGSVKGLLSGTSFNRCKQIHPAVSMVFKMLHCKRFLHEYQNEFELSTALVSILENSEKDAIIHDLEKFLLAYDQFWNDTLEGKLGQTAKFVSIYVHYIDTYHIYEHAIRNNDIELFTYASSLKAPIFFHFNHQNYARWMIRNIDNLHTKTELFRNGGLSVQRGQNSFSRSPVDLTVEQTVNCNAANKLRGVLYNTNNVSGRQKWAATHCGRVSLLNELYEFVGIKGYPLDSKTKSKNFDKNVLNFMNAIETSLNPFDENLNEEQLFHLTTGKAASPEICEFLTNTKTLGEKKMNEFIAECKADPDRFYKPIKKNTIHTFSSNMHKSRNTSQSRVNSIVNEIRTERDIIGNILCMILQAGTDLNDVLCFPLTSVPCSLGKYDGTIHQYKTLNSMSTLYGSNIIGEETISPTANIEIIDGMSFFNSLTDFPPTYGAVCEKVLKQLCDTTAVEIYIMFAKDPTSKSIKNYYVSNEIYNQQRYTVSGPSQKRPDRFVKCFVTNWNFQQQFIQFALNYWKSADIDVILGSKRLFVSYGGDTFLFSAAHTKGMSVSSLKNNHLELETRMILFLSKMSPNMRVLIRTENSDVLLTYLLYHMLNMAANKSIWIETSIKNEKKLLDVRKIYESCDKEVLEALPGWFAFTGCRYEPAFYGRTKKNCFKIMSSNQRARLAFSLLGVSGTHANMIEEPLEEYTCKLYNMNSDNVNQCRVDLFLRANKQGKGFNEKGRNLSHIYSFILSSH